MTLYLLHFKNKNEKVYFSTVSRNNKDEWVYERTGILFDSNYVKSQGNCYFLLVQEHAEVVRAFETNPHYSTKKNIYEKNCSIFLYKDKCYSLGYINSLFLIPVQTELLEK